MKKIILAAIAILVSILLSSCEKEIKFNGKYDGEKLVLFSCVNPDAVIYAKVNHSTFFLSKNTTSGNDPVTDAVVTAEIDGVEHPLKFNRELNRYECNVKPSVGSKVIIKASREGYKTVQGEVVVPKRPKVSFTVGEIEPEYLENGMVKQYKVHLKIMIEGAEPDVNYLRLTAFRKSIMYTPEEGTDLDDVNSWQQDYLWTRELAFFATNAESILDNVGEKDPHTIIPDYFDDGKFVKGRALDTWMVIYPLGIYTDNDGNTVLTSSEREMNFDISNFKITVESLSQDLFCFLMSRDSYYSKEDGIGSVFSEPVAIHNNIQNGIGCVGAVASTTASY